MTKFTFLILPLVALLISCGGSSDSSKETTKPQPAPFSIEVSHLTEATENQSIDIVISASKGHTISNSELTVDLDIPMDITEVSSTEYSITVPAIYKEQSITLFISASNEQGDTRSTSSVIALTYNKPPQATLLTNEPVVKNGTSVLEFSVEDNHQLESLSLTSAQQGVEISKLTDTSFEVTLNDTFTDDRLVLTAEAVDEFQAKRTQDHYFDFDKPYLRFWGGNYALLADQSYVSVSLANESDTQSIASITWSQLSGPLLTIENTNSTSLSFTSPATYSPENIRLQAKVTLNDDTELTIEHEITLIEDKPYTISTLDKEFVDNKLSQRETKDTDLNDDGLADIITIENAIAYVQLQNTEGNYNEKEKIGEVTFHQWLRNGPVPAIHMPTAESLRITEKSISLQDADNDGIKDIVFTGGINYPLAAINESIGGWLKGRGNQKFYGDFISDGIAADNFFDINKDGYLDWLYYTDWDSPAYAYVNMSFAIWPSTKNAHADINLLISKRLQAYDDSFGYAKTGSEFTMIRLYSTRKPWEYKEGEPSNYERITITKYLPEESFHISYGIRLNERARLIYFVDVTNDGIKDIVICDWDNNYYLVTPEH